MLVELVSFHLDPVRRPRERLQIGDRDPQVFEAKCPQCLEAEDVADDRGHHVDHRPLFEEVERISDVRHQLIGLPFN